MTETQQVMEKQEALWKTKFDSYGEFLGYLPIWRRKHRKHTALLFLVRHGRSILNEHKRLQPWTPDGDLLSPTGRVQSQLLGRILRFVDFNEVYTSDFQRAEETAQLILAHQREKNRIKVRTDHTLRDFNFGKLAGLSISREKNEVAELFPDIYDLYLHHRDQFYAPEGDRLSEFAAHAMARAEEIAHRHVGRVVLLVSHEAWIKSIIYSSWKRPLSDFNSLKIKNASISILEHKKSSPSLDVLAVNDTQHLT